ncbi:MAG: choice-of-anchor L domain-containing protein [Candidatus Cloacimonetes bacterium]|nr:choice-of-anchor L domain-containing protein [Candidatus Cloacimonadota bacterium]MCF7815018.1 choice-of-anchor L domain-containing protein [Candidatus Cloacimonadota bacterium]MCF7869261.1 choice-of-anchor L domain-containing protein [Candidatus Cloacimonadota bacterium]
MKAITRLFVLLSIILLMQIFNLTAIARNVQSKIPNTGAKDLLLVEFIGYNVTPETMVDSLIGDNANVFVTNINYTGEPIASGVFGGAMDEGLEFDSGVILSSGYAQHIYGPNDSPAISGNNYVPGSPNLNNLIPNGVTHDASILEFDFIPKYNTISFSYIFCSDEYLEFIGYGYNDVFGLFVDNANVAMIPGTSVPVSIENVNNVSYPDFYQDNPQVNGNFNLEADGFVVPLEVTIRVEPEVSHHVSFEIADVGDFDVDSWVFLEAGSFKSVQCSTYFEVILTNGFQHEINEGECVEIEAIATGEDEAIFNWTLTTPQYGTAEFISNDYIDETRTILYTPYEDFFGVDAFALTVTDGLGGLINRFIEINVLPVTDPPVCTLLPEISGNFYLNQMVHCDEGEWNDDIDNQYASPGNFSTVNYNYQWLRSSNGSTDWIEIDGALNENYTIVQEDVDHYIRCKIEAVDNGIGSGGNFQSIEFSNIQYCEEAAGVYDLISGNAITRIYPNPFNPSTNISFQLQTSSKVEMIIYNSKGQFIKELLNDQISAGHFECIWNGKDSNNKRVSTGEYFAKLKMNGEEVEVKKMMLLK